MPPCCFENVQGCLPLRVLGKVSPAPALTWPGPAASPRPAEGSGPARRLHSDRVAGLRQVPVRDSCGEALASPAQRHCTGLSWVTLNMHPCSQCVAGYPASPFRYSTSRFRCPAPAPGRCASSCAHTTPLLVSEAGGAVRTGSASRFWFCLGVRAGATVKVEESSSGED